MKKPASARNPVEVRNPRTLKKVRGSLLCTLGLWERPVHVERPPEPLTPWMADFITLLSPKKVTLHECMTKAVENVFWSPSHNE